MMTRGERLSLKLRAICNSNLMLYLLLMIRLNDALSILEFDYSLPISRLLNYKIISFVIYFTGYLVQPLNVHGSVQKTNKVKGY